MWRGGTWSEIRGSADVLEAPGCTRDAAEWVEKTLGFVPDAIQRRHSLRTIASPGIIRPRSPIWSWSGAAPACSPRPREPPLNASEFGRYK